MCVCAQKPVQPRYVLVMTLSVSLFSRPHPSMCLFCLGLKWTPAHVEKSRPLKTDTCTRTHTHKHAQIRIYSVSLHNFKTLTQLLLYFHNIYESLSIVFVILCQSNYGLSLFVDTLCALIPQ